MVLFGSTISPPAEQQKSGFQVGTRRYVWMFPSEMEVSERAVVPMLGLPVEGGTATTTGQAMGVLREQIAQLRARIDKASAIPGGINPASPGLNVQLEMLNLDLKQLEELSAREHEAVPVFKRPNYDAECSYSADGRFILYAHIEDAKEGEKPDANIYIYDTQTKQDRAIVVAPGYDGGPFFSPDGKRICYRSDRKGNDQLQLFVADLRFDGDVPVGITREYQVTDNEHVNWAPYFSPDGSYLVYGSSEAGHDNYEIFAVALDPARLAAAATKADGKTAVVADLPRVRVTHAPGADVLPVFTHDGSVMMWTSQRGPGAEGEEKPSSQLWIATVKGRPFAPPAPQAAE
jgi:Tol biopolymer transport system component